MRLTLTYILHCGMGTETQFSLMRRYWIRTCRDDEGGSGSFLTQGNVVVRQEADLAGALLVERG